MRLLLLLPFALIAGCAEMERQNRDAEIAAEQQAIIDYCRNGLQAVALDPIRAKVPALLGMPQPTLEMLSDRSFATDAQRPAILALDAAAVDCVNRRGQLAMKYFGSDYAAVEGAASTDAQRNRLALYQGTITWGQYVARAREIGDQVRGLIAALNERRRQSGIQQQAANAQSAAAAAAMMRAAPAFQPIQPLTLQPIPQQPINCTTFRQGQYSNTTCR